MANYNADKYVVEADFNNGPVVDAEAGAKGNSATDDCELELLGT